MDVAHDPLLLIKEVMLGLGTCIEAFVGVLYGSSTQVDGFDTRSKRVC